MRIFELKNITAELYEIYITIDIPECYAEIIEIYREGENEQGFVQVTSIKMIEPDTGFDQDDNNDIWGFLP